MAGANMLRRSRRGKAAPAGVRQRRLQASATRPNHSQRALEAESGLGMEALLAHTCCAGACVTDGDGLQTTRARILTRQRQRIHTSNWQSAAEHCDAQLVARARMSQQPVLPM